MTTKLYVGNLSFDTTEDGIRQAFAPFGPVTEVKLITDRETGASRGFSFVTMGSVEAADNAISQLSGFVLDGRPLRVDRAEERKQRFDGARTR
jgi:RNA recognition motif-containing protein